MVEKPKIVEATGTTRALDGPSRSAALQAAMSQAEVDFMVEHNRNVEKWRTRKNQDDGTNAPIVDYKSLLARKVAARTKAKVALVDRTPTLEAAPHND